MNVLLISLPMRSMRLVSIPLGVGYVAAALERQGAVVHVKNLTLDSYAESDLLRGIREREIDLVGLSVNTVQALDARRLIATLKKNTGVKVVVGGPHPSVAPEDLLEGGADFAVMGEGEGSIVDLMRHLNGEMPVEAVKGIAYRNNGEIRNNGKRRTLQDLDELPVPAFHLLDLPRATALGARVPMLASRGCPAGCHFCTKAVFGFRYRSRAPRSVVDEIEMLCRDYRIRQIDLVDNDLLKDNEWLEEVCRLLAERRLEVQFRFQGRVDHNIRPDVLTRLVERGFVHVYFGIESGSQRILDRINKGITLEQAKAAVAGARQAGMEIIEAGFILGFPDDTPETLEETLRFIGELDATHLLLQFLAPWPGTKVWRQIEQNAAVEFDYDYRDLIVHQPHFSTANFDKRTLWAVYRRILFHRMKKRFPYEVRRLPTFFSRVVSRDASIGEALYRCLPAASAFVESLGAEKRSREVRQELESCS